MKSLSVAELPHELEGFAGGMGFKSIRSVSESDLGFDVNLDVKGYISEEVNGNYYAEVIDGDGNAQYASGTIDEMEKWVTDTVYELSKEMSL